MPQLSSNPMEEHLQKALYIVHYLLSSQDLCICILDMVTNMVYVLILIYIDWAGDIETSHSTTGYVIFLGNGIVSWLSM